LFLDLKITKLKDNVSEDKVSKNNDC